MLETTKPNQTQAERDYLINRFNTMDENLKTYYDDNDMVIVEMVEYKGEILIQLNYVDYNGEPTDNFVDITDDWLMDMEE